MEQLKNILFLNNKYHKMYIEDTFFLKNFKSIYKIIIDVSQFSKGYMLKRSRSRKRDKNMQFPLRDRNRKEWRIEGSHKLSQVNRYD